MRSYYSLSFIVLSLILNGCAEEQYKGEVYSAHSYHSAAVSRSSVYQGEQVSARTTTNPYQGRVVGS